jgi:hypothetical protein
MTENSLSTTLRLKDRFLRSTDLKRDFGDAQALDGYWLTEFGATCLRTVATGVRTDSGRRAWRLTGDYGTGKSSFALFLATAMADVSRLPNGLRRKALRAAPEIVDAGYMPVLVVGSRQSIGVAIIAALQQSIANAYPRGGAADLLRELQRHGKRGNVSDDQVVALVEESARTLAKTGKAKGLMIVLDEVGKFLEFAANSGGSEDIYLLQTLSEAASRSKSVPIFVICLLHQGFNAYADQLQPVAQREWAKIAGRLDEIAFTQPLEEVFALTQAALGVQVASLPEELRRGAREVMAQAAKLQWFGASTKAAAMVEHADGIFPIDAFVFPALGRLFQRFGQNERSLFSFIYSYEPFGLRDYAARPIRGCLPYRLCNLYDYTRATFGHRLAVVSYRSRWAMIDAIVDGFVAKTDMDIEVLKTVGMLNLLDGDDLPPSAEVVEWSVGGADRGRRQAASKCLQELRERGVLYLRGASKGFCLWPYTSVDLEKAYDDAKRQLGETCNVAEYVAEQVEERPIVARRHYIETGNLRSFTVKYCPMSRLEEALASKAGESDGEIIIPLCETKAERAEAIKWAFAARTVEERIRLIGVPLPLERLRGIVVEASRWDWIAVHVLALNNDSYARMEVSRHRTFAQEKVHAALEEAVSPAGQGATDGLTWFRDGKAIEAGQGRGLVSRLSDLCDTTYNKAPRLHNELVNRRSLSSAAAAARMRLIEAMFDAHDKDALGLPLDRKPPEMSIYMSVLRNTGIHRLEKGRWTLGVPVGPDPCRVAPCMQRLRLILEEHPDERVGIQKIVEEMKRPPYGLREGIIPVLLAIVAISQEKEVALYENGTFLREVGQEAFLRMTKNPALFDIQYCQIAGVRAELFAKLAGALGLESGDEREPELMDVVRQICTFVAKLPEYCRNTKRVSKTCEAVRATVLAAKEPIRMVFHELPVACGCPAIEHRKRLSSEQTAELVSTLRKALTELRDSFPALQERMRQRLCEAFAVSGGFSGARREIAERAERVVLGATEPGLKAFCLRIMDDALPEGDWLESVGSVLAKQPPTRWQDANEDMFIEQLGHFVERMKRVEAARFRNTTHNVGEAIRIALTKTTGEERQEVIIIREKDHRAMASAEAAIEAVLKAHGRIGLAAASKALWKRLDGSQT